jgi:hypothetical protein
MGMMRWSLRAGQALSPAKSRKCRIALVAQAVSPAIRFFRGF